MIYPLDRNEAAIAVVDSNLHREHILPSEKAFAYKLKMEAMKQQGKRTDLTLSQVATKSDSAAEIGKAVNESRRILQNAEQHVVDLRLVLRTLREMTDIKELTPTLVNSLIERIEVHNNDKYDGHCHVKVDIYFTAVGMIDIPAEKEILATTEEIRNNPQDFKFVA